MRTAGGKVDRANISAFIEAVQLFNSNMPINRSTFYEELTKIIANRNPTDQLAKILEFSKHVLEVAEKGKDMVPVLGPKSLSSNEGNNAPTKVDTIYQEIYNKYGNSENLPWPPGGSRTVGEGKDSVGKDGKRVHVKKIYKKKG